MHSQKILKKSFRVNNYTFPSIKKSELEQIGLAQDPPVLLVGDIQVVDQISGVSFCHRARVFLPDDKIGDFGVVLHVLQTLPAFDGHFQAGSSIIHVQPINWAPIVSDVLITFSLHHRGDSPLSVPVRDRPGWGGHHSVLNVPGQGAAVAERETSLKCLGCEHLLFLLTC